MGLGDDAYFELFEGDRDENYNPVNLIKEFHISLQKGFDSWYKFDIFSAAPKDKKLYVVIHMNKNVGIYMNNEILTGVVSFIYIESGAFTESNPQYIRNKLLRIDSNIAFSIEPQQEVYSKQNILGPYYRPYGLPNLWISEPVVNSSEHWIELNLGKPSYIEEIAAVFNARTEDDWISYDIGLSAAIPQLVKDYDIYVQDECGCWDLLHEIRGNYLKCRKHSISKVVAGIKLILRQTNGSKYFEVFGIKMKFSK